MAAWVCPQLRGESLDLGLLVVLYWGRFWLAVRLTSNRWSTRPRAVGARLLSARGHTQCKICCIPCPSEQQGWLALRLATRHNPIHSAA